MLKYAGHNDQREMQVYLVNYLVAGTLAIFFTQSDLTILFTEEARPSLIFGVMVGLLYISNLILMGRSMVENGIGMTVSIMRISLVIPVLVSIFIYGESTTTQRLVGLLFAFIALGLLFRPGEKERDTRAILYLVAIFLITGMGDVSLKVFEATATPGVDKWLFMAIIFVTCGIISLVYVLLSTKPLPNNREIKSGILIGIPNLLASIFILMALELIPASITFPSTNLTIIVVGTIWGWWYWKDALTTRNYIIIGLAMIAIVLLTLDV